jgi:cytochrome o ubiquinol oxidase operon protein cyoD
MKQVTRSPVPNGLQSYIIGFLLSLMLTFGMYILVINRVLADSLLVPVIITLALTQLIVQLFFFLHLAHEEKPRWQLVFFLLTAGTILGVVLGSLWIMQHLNYNMMPEHVEEYIIQDEGIKQK